MAPTSCSIPIIEATQCIKENSTSGQMTFMFLILLMAVIIGAFLTIPIFTRQFGADKHFDLYSELVETTLLLANNFSVAETINRTPTVTSCVDSDNLHLLYQAGIGERYKGLYSTPTSSALGDYDAVHYTTRLGHWTFVAGCVNVISTACIGINVAVFGGSSTELDSYVLIDKPFLMDPFRKKPLSWNSPQRAVSPAFAAIQKIPSGIFCPCIGPPTKTCLLE